MKEKPSHYKELLKRAFFNLKLSSLAIIIITATLGVVMYAHVEDVILFSWLFLMFGVSFFRLLSSNYYKNHAENFSLQEWTYIFYVPLILSSLLWGYASFFFFLEESVLYQAMLVVMIAGLSAGAVSSLSSLKGAVYIFTSFLVIPLIIKLAMQGGFEHNIMAALVTLYFFLLNKIAAQIHAYYLDIIISREMYEEEKEKVLQSEERFGKIFKQAPLGIVIYDSDLIIREANQELVDFLEAPLNYLLGLDLHTLPDQSLTLALESPLDDMEGFYEGEYRTKFKQKDLWISMSTAPLKDLNNNIIGGIGIISDITQRMLTQLKYEYQASHDQLTNIPNRSTLLEKIKYELIRYKRHEAIFGLIFLDLDNFKNINDSLGHDMGDKLLIQVAQRLKKIIRVEDTVARIGGDEFVVLLPDLATDQNKSATNAEYIAQKVHTILRKPFEIEGYKLNISSSIGIALVDETQKDEHDLLKHADMAMYQAKKAGKNTTTFYQCAMDTWVKRRLGIENGLRGAIENKEFEIHYQPIVAFSSGEIRGVEALLRWNSQEFGSVTPDEFIPIAEESGLIINIGKWVLENSVKQFIEWKSALPEYDGFKKIAVNISVRQFNYSGFVKQVEDIIKYTGINPKNLELELVESVIVQEVESVRQKMQQLRKVGVQISIDDFGTGYSSLSYLKSLPFTTLKIDKSFIQDIEADIDDKELISTILTIAKNFNLEVIAEGVELSEQYSFLDERNCDYMQGYYCAKPMDAKSFEAFLASGNGYCQRTRTTASED
ncbi:MAG: EAL domain-containing protein [Sulfurimonas sp.]|nr:EAL domain-containing protein [Sulfurimonas sp.]